jgi:hypothetical protein
MIGGSIPGRGWEFFSSPPCPDRHWSRPSLLSNGAQLRESTGIALPLPSDIIRVIKLRISARHASSVWVMRNVHNILVGKSEAKRRLGRPRRRWKFNIRIDLKERDCEDMVLINLPQDMDQYRAHLSTVMKLRRGFH